ncbi:MAG: hypothetical protein R3C03_10350 [Pirellulaceae bacterium]
MCDVPLRPALNIEVEVSRYDRTVASLSSAILVVGFLVTILFLVWLGAAYRFQRILPPIFIRSVEAEKPDGVADEILEPGVEEFPEVEFPQIAMALEVVTHALSSVRASSEHFSGDATQTGPGRGPGGSRKGVDTGPGHVVPEYKRWKIGYEASTVETYSKMLSYFNIDVGLVYSSKNDIARLVDPGGAGRIVWSSRAEESNSVYFAHETLQLQRFDNALFKRKGIETGEAFTVQFYPEPTKEMLRSLEQAYLQKINRKLENVQDTRFQVVPTPTGYEFVVTDIKFRRR